MAVISGKCERCGQRKSLVKVGNARLCVQCAAGMAKGKEVQK